MDIRTAATAKNFTEHVDVIIHSLVPKFTMRDETLGGYLEFVDIFEIAAGAKAEPHTHDTHEFYFILEGEPIVQIEDEAHPVNVHELVHIPRNARHTIWPTGGKGVKALCFSVSYQEPFDPGYVPVDLPEVDVTPRPDATPSASH